MRGTFSEVAPPSQVILVLLILLFCSVTLPWVCTTICTINNQYDFISYYTAVWDRDTTVVVDNIGHTYQSNHNKNASAAGGDVVSFLCRCKFDCCELAFYATAVYIF